MAEQQMEYTERAPQSAPELPPSEQKAKSGNGNLTAGVILIALGALFGIGQLFDFGDITGSLITGGIAIVFAAVYVTGTSRWWALIPAWVFGAVSIFIMVEPLLRGEMDGAYWVLAVAVPFFVTFITNPRERWWALIPFYVMAVTAVFLTMVDRVLRDEAIGAYWTGAVALPFLVVFATNPKERWWALIPGGIFTVAALGLGLAAFEMLRWGIPVLMVLAGAGLLAGQFMRRAPQTESSESPFSGPGADKAR